MYVTDINGNLDSCTANVTVADTVLPTPICKDTTVYLDNLGQYTIDSSYINNGSADNCGIATITLSRYNFNCIDVGINQVTMVVTDVNGNVDSCSANVTVVDTTGPIAVCMDTTIYLDATGQYTIDSSYVDDGSNDACGVITLSQSLFTCADVGPNNVTLYVTDANSNVDSCTAIVTVLDTVRPQVVCMDSLIYLDSTGQYTIDSSYVNNGSNDACGIASISLSRTVFNCTDTGINNVTLYVADVNGNIDSCIAQITVRDSIIPPAYAGIDDSLCATYVYNLNGNIPPGTFVGTWTILTAPNIPTIANVNMGNTSVSNLVEGVYEFVWTVTNGAGCNIASDTVSISVFEQPLANAGLDTSLCNTYSMNMRANLLVGSSTGAWTTSSGPTLPVFASPTSPTSNISNLIEGRYVLVWTVSNGSCIPVTDTMILDVYDMPVSNAGNDVNLCNNYSAILIGNTPVGSSSGVWSYASGPNVPNIVTPNSALTGVNGLIEGTYEMVWTVSNGTCPPVTDTVLINVYDQPVAIAGPDTNLCAVYNLNLYANQPVGTAQGRWIIDPGTTPPSQPVFSDSSQYNTNVSNLVEGTYQLLWIMTNGTCTADVDTLVIHVWDRPVADAGPDTNLCATYALQFYAAPLSGLAQGYWRLDPTANNPNVPTVINAGLPNASVTGLIEGTYRFVWEVTNGPCFSFTDTLIVNVYDQPVAIVGPDQDLCFETSTIISAIPLTGLSTGTWYLANGTPNNPTFNSLSPTTTVGNLQEAGQYVLYWEAVNGTCPVSRDSIVINNFAVPIAQFTQDTTEVCAGDCIQFTDLSTIHPSDNISTHYWSAGGDILYDQDPMICWPNPGVYDVSLIVESSNGCRDTINKPNLIDVFTVPIADFNTFLVDDPNISTKIQVQDASQYSTSYWYSFGDGSSPTTQQNPSHIYLDSGFYDITQIVYNNFGCSDTLVRTIFVHILVVYVPNTFTPDGNGVNERFFPFVDGDDPDAFLFRVFDRWGKLVYQTQNKNDGWDGTYKGSNAKTDTYVWTLRTKYKDGERIKEYRGHVNLLR